MINIPQHDLKKIARYFEDIEPTGSITSGVYYIDTESEEIKILLNLIKQNSYETK
jgi:hypothetical protein